MITLTGLDYCTNYQKLIPLKDYFEAGLLWREVPASLHMDLLPQDLQNMDRYVQLSHVQKVSEIFPRTALHVCGKAARATLKEGGIEVVRALKNVRRIQVNGQITYQEINEICQLYQDKVIITQLNEKWPFQIDLKEDKLPHNHRLLVDASGGRGKLPESWPTVYTTPKECFEGRIGFAGGLGPDNLDAQLDAIAKANPVIRENTNFPPFWVDMETGVRTDDLFDVDKAIKCILIALNWKKEFHR